MLPGTIEHKIIKMALISVAIFRDTFKLCTVS